MLKVKVCVEEGVLPPTIMEEVKSLENVQVEESSSKRKISTISAHIYVTDNREVLRLLLNMQVLAIIFIGKPSDIADLDEMEKINVFLVNSPEGVPQVIKEGVEELKLLIYFSPEI